jgi:hypothetical protein
VGDQLCREAARDRLRLVLEELVEDLLLALGVGARAAEQTLQVGLAADDPAEPEQLVLDGVEPAVGLGRREERLAGDHTQGLGEVVRP